MTGMFPHARLGVIAASALLAGCWASRDPGAAARGLPRALMLAFEPPATCRLDVAGESFAWRGEDRALLERLRSERRRSKAARVEFAQDIPYKCIGWAIYTAQMAGFRQVNGWPRP